MIEKTVDILPCNTIANLEFLTLLGLGIAKSVKRQFKYWSNRAISTRMVCRVLSIARPSDSRSSALSGGVATVGNGRGLRLIH